MTALLLVALLGLPPGGAPSTSTGVPLERFALHAVSVEGCAHLPVPRGDRELWLAGPTIVDREGRYWMLDRPVLYEAGRATRRYVVGDGSLRVDAQLSDDLREERVSLRVEQPIGPSFLRAYLPDAKLPCERVTRFSVEPLEPAPGNLAELAAFDAELHAAEELLYDERFAEAEEHLRVALELRPADPAPYWMLARLRYRQLEEGGERPRDELLRGWQETEHWADQAVERAVLGAEGYLWQGIARGRLATSQGNLAVAVESVTGGRGARWLERTLERAVSLPDQFRFFGASTRGDALHALAQFYRLAPDGWYMTLVGARGDIDRAIELSHQALRQQPGRIEYRMELAIEYLCRDQQGDAEQAQAQLRTVLGLPAITPTDRLDRRIAAELLSAPPEEPCEYSRASKIGPIT